MNYFIIRKLFSLILLLTLAIGIGLFYPSYTYVEGIVKTDAPIESVLTASANEIRFRFALLDLNN